MLAEELAKEMVERLQKFAARGWGTGTLGLIRADVLAFLCERFPALPESLLEDLVMTHVRIDDAAARLEADFDAMAKRILEQQSPTA